MSLDNTVNVFILYGCTLSKERSSMRIVAATTDEEMLHTIIGAQILGGTMDYWIKTSSSVGSCEWMLMISS